MVLNNRYTNDGKVTATLNSIQKAGVEAFRKKEYKMADVTECMVCKGNNFEALSEKDRYGLPYRVVICKDCGLVFANPYFSPEELPKFYNDDTPVIYRGLSEEISEETHKLYFDKKYKNKGKRIFEYISNNHTPIEQKIIVEIGCASGGILKYFKDQGNEVFGADYGKKYIDFGKKQGLDLFEGDCQTLIDRGIKADVLIYADVLEHIPNLDSEIKKIESILNKDGVLYIGLPSIKKPIDFLGQLQNAHVYYFTLKTLTNLFSKHGFSLIAGTEDIYAIFSKNNNGENKNIENAYQEILEHLHQKEKERNQIISRIKRLIRSTKQRIFSAGSNLKKTLGVSSVS